MLRWLHDVIRPRPAGSAIRCFIVVAVAACGASTGPNGAGGSPLIPLTVGARWTYAASDTIVGSVPGGRLEPDSTFTVRVLAGPVDVGGTPWASVDSLYRLLDTVPDSGGGLYANEANGFYHLLSGVLSSRILGFPVAIGLLTNYGTVVVATDTIITVPAGTFHCIRYDRDESSVPSPGSFDPVDILFIAPGFGIVKRIETHLAYEGGTNEVLGRLNRVFLLTGSNVPLPAAAALK
jgi:hypothetical protein